MKKTTFTGKNIEQLTDLLKEKQAELTKAMMVFGPKASTRGIKKDIARINTELSMLAKQTH